MIINTAISGGTKGFRRYTYEVPEDVSGVGSYITVVSQDAALARVRSFASLVVLYHLAGDISCTKSGIACNTAGYLPCFNAGPGIYGGALRRREDGGMGGNTMQTVPIDDDTGLSTGSGHTYITPDGDLRIYCNTSAYPIKAGTALVEVIWEEDA